MVAPHDGAHKTVKKTSFRLLFDTLVKHTKQRIMKKRFLRMGSANFAFQVAFSTSLIPLQEDIQEHVVAQFAPFPAVFLLMQSISSTSDESI